MVEVFAPDHAWHPQQIEGLMRAETGEQLCDCIETLYKIGVAAGKVVKEEHFGPFLQLQAKAAS
jgi:hypothetical protein